MNFKLHCIAYLKPFEGKPFNELLHSKEKWSHNVIFNNLKFKHYNLKSFGCVDDVSKHDYICL